MDGLDCTVALRSLQPASSLRPFVVAHTADSTPEMRARCAAAGVDAFLPKPFKVEALMALLKEAYAHTKRQHEHQLQQH
jgi:CheY-like chemotaxis protein